MFFADRIQSILPQDKVLEIGPGSTPHPRSDVFLELAYKTDDDEQAQFGHTGKLITDKEIVYYDGGAFPFDDQQFDYIICSHVLEHVDDIPFFLSELFRVGKKGYLEYPNIYYDYLFNFDVHQNLIRMEAGEMKWMKKEDTPLNEFKIVQNDFYNLLKVNHFKLFIKTNQALLFEGFEWDKPFKDKKCTNISEVVHKREDKLITNPSQFILEDYIQHEISFKGLSKILLKKVRNKFKS